MKDYNVLEYITPDELKKFRKKFHMTQNEFAKIIGVSKPTIERWETGDKKITGPVVLLIDLLSENDSFIDFLLLKTDVII